MLFSDTYQTPAGPGEGEFKDKGSKFIGYSFPVTTEEEIKGHINQLKKEHFSAAHHCYAYVLGPGMQLQKSHDDREPNNTAGKPILRAILSRNLTNTLVVVVRYFGGKLLGVPGLIHAYGEAAVQSLANVQVLEKITSERYEVSGDYEHENELYKIYKSSGAKIISHTYNENRFSGVFEIRKSKGDEVVKAIKEKRLFEVTFIGEI